jgi:hypothetical protein
VNSNRILEIKTQLKNEGWIFPHRNCDNIIPPYKIDNKKELDKESSVKGKSEKEGLGFQINNFLSKIFG